MNHPMRRQPTFSFKIFAELSIFRLLSEVLHLFNRFVAEEKKRKFRWTTPNSFFQQETNPAEMGEDAKKLGTRIRFNGFDRKVSESFSSSGCLSSSNRNTSMSMFFRNSVPFPGLFFPQKYTLVILKVIFVFAFQWLWLDCQVEAKNLVGEKKIFQSFFYDFVTRAKKGSGDGTCDRSNFFSPDSKNLGKLTSTEIERRRWRRRRWRWRRRQQRQRQQQ